MDEEEKIDKLLANSPMSSTKSSSTAYADSDFEEAKRVPGMSRASSSLGEKIRSSLPNIGRHLKRLMRLKNRETSNELEVNEVRMDLVDARNSEKKSLAAEEEDVQASALSSESQEPPSPASNLIEENCNVSTIASSSSSADSPSIYQPRTSDDSMESRATVSSIFEEPVIPANLMISSSVEARLDELSERMTLASVLTEEGAIIAGDPLDFAAAFNAQLGYDRIRTYAELQARRDLEPRSIPLLYFQGEPRRDPYFDSSASGERGSSTSGINPGVVTRRATLSNRSSENSIENDVSEVDRDNPETWTSGQNTRNGRDQAQRQYYDAALRNALRKRFRHLDDEPPIY